MKNLINLMILASLNKEDKYGLQIIKDIKTVTELNFDLKLPSLYNSIKRLEGYGYLKSYWENSEIGGKRRYCSLTEKGRNFLQEQLPGLTENEKIKFQLLMGEKEKSDNISNSNLELAIQPNFFNQCASNTTVATDTEDNIEDTNVILDNQISLMDDALTIKDALINEPNNNDIIDEKNNEINNNYQEQNNFNADKTPEQKLNFKDIFGDIVYEDKNQLENAETISSNNGLIKNQGTDAVFLSQHETIEAPFILSKQKIEKIVADLNNEVDNINNESIDNDNKNNEIETNQNEINDKTDATIITDKQIIDENYKINVTLKSENKNHNQTIKNIAASQNIVDINEIVTDNFNENLYNDEENDEINSNINYEEDNLQNEQENYPTSSLIECLDYLYDIGIGYSLYDNSFFAQNTKHNKNKYYKNKFRLWHSFLSVFIAGLIILSTYIFLDIQDFVIENQDYFFITLSAILVLDFLYCLIKLIKSPKLLANYKQKNNKIIKLPLYICVIGFLIVLAICLFTGMTFTNYQYYLTYIIMPLLLLVISYINIFIEYKLVKNERFFIKNE